MSTWLSILGLLVGMFWIGELAFAQRGLEGQLSSSSRKARRGPVFRMHASIGVGASSRTWDDPRTNLDDDFGADVMVVGPYALADLRGYPGNFLVGGSVFFVVAPPRLPVLGENPIGKWHSSVYFGYSFRASFEM